MFFKGRQEAGGCVTNQPQTVNIAQGKLELLAFLLPSPTLFITKPLATDS